MCLCRHPLSTFILVYHSFSVPFDAFLGLAIERFYFSDGHTSEQGILLAGQSGLAQLAKTQKTYVPNQSSTLTKLGQFRMGPNGTRVFADVANLGLIDLWYLGTHAN